MNCIICDSNKQKLILNVDKFPYFTAPLPKNDKRKLLNNNKNFFGDLSYLGCKDCGHLQINKLPNQEVIEGLYSQYYTYPSALDNNFEPTRDKYFLDFFKENIHPLCQKAGLNSVLEIGCFDGYVLRHLQNEGYITLGCDPSEGSKIGQAHGINILREYFKAETFIVENKYFDLVISRHFIEHVFDPYKYINDFGKVLNSNGLLVIETPNIEHFINLGLLEAFSLQHISLFTETSLKYALIKSGFKVVSVSTTPENLIIVSTKSDYRNNTEAIDYSYTIDNFSHRVEKNIAELAGLINKLNKWGGRVAIWGAGGFGICAIKLYSINENDIIYFIDIDSKKWNMEYLNYSIPIVSPSYAMENPPSIIIIASMYSEEILKNINKNFCEVKKILLTPFVKLL